MKVLNEALHSILSELHISRPTPLMSLRAYYAPYEFDNAIEEARKEKLIYVVPFTNGSAILTHKGQDYLNYWERRIN